MERVRYFFRLVSANLIDLDPARVEPMKHAIEHRPSETIIGSMVRDLSHTRRQLHSTGCYLRCEIDRLTEELRQTDEAESAITTALAAIGTDKALTEEEKSLAVDSVSETLAQPILSIHVDDDLDAEAYKAMLKTVSAATGTLGNDNR